MRQQIEAQTTLENTDEAIDTLKVCLLLISCNSNPFQKCLRVLGLTNRIHELIEKKKSYAALRALDGIPFAYNSILKELQNVHLNEIIQFDFAEVIRQVAFPLYPSILMLSVNTCDTTSYCKTPSWQT